ncbi:hypothetical protein RJ639_030255 [Escallonia herrerae]|uniref:DNA topoisomerase n=1 Tax=Escallonia herrerae TaxID=1293975 RepID=A0AA88XD77_9ASTE|nr:hypothetical protein RJ639_030255 [Escallonia herrerae]
MSRSVGRQLCKTNKGIPYGARMLSVYWTMEQDFGGTRVMEDMMTKPILPFTQQDFRPENLVGVRTIIFVQKLYELVVRHFLACVSQPAVGAETIVEIDIAGELFSASGRVILARNYLDVYRFESWGGSIIPTYTVGQQFTPTTLTLDTGVTRPPPLLSEADLLNCMDKAGIGTDATMHDHIKKLLDRFYATKDSNTRFSPTNLGEALVMGYDDMGRDILRRSHQVVFSNALGVAAILCLRMSALSPPLLVTLKLRQGYFGGRLAQADTFLRVEGQYSSEPLRLAYHLK